MTLSKLSAWLPVAVFCLLFASGLRAGDAPVHMAVTDLEGLEQVQREFGGFRDRLAKETGLAIEFYAVPSRTAAVEAMNAKKVDLVLTGPAEHVVFRKRTGAVPVLGFSRPDYFATIVVLADSGLGRVADLRGKKVALGPVGSTSKRGDVAAFGTTNDKFLKLREHEKTMAPESFRVIARGPDLPNDVLLARADLDAHRRDHPQGDLEPQ